MAYRDGGDLNALGASIAERCRACGMSQEELAHACLVSRPTISSWERGRTQPSAQDVKLLAAAFDITADELLSACEPVARAVSADRREMKLLVFADGVLAMTAFWGLLAMHFDPRPFESWPFGVVVAGLPLLIVVELRQAKLGEKFCLTKAEERLRFAAGAIDPRDMSGLPAWMRWVLEHVRLIRALLFAVIYLMAFLLMRIGVTERLFGASLVPLLCWFVFDFAFMILLWRVEMRLNR